jgi:hypothetical protein
MMVTTTRTHFPIVDQLLTGIDVRAGAAFAKYALANGLAGILARLDWDFFR